MPAELIFRRAPKGAASSWNAETRTFRAVIAAGAAVRRWDRAGEYIEILDHAGVELPAKIPLLNAHRAHDVRDVIGTVETVERVDARIEAVIRLSAREGVEGVAQDVAAGVLSGVSVGYIVKAWREEISEAGERVKTATKWRLLEVSLVPVPADDAARVRSFNVENTEENAMAPAIETRAADHLDRAEITRRERIMELADRVGFREFGEQHARSGTDLEEFRTLLINHIAEEQERTQPRGGGSIGATMHVGGIAPEQRSAAMAEALAARIDSTIAPSPMARRYVGLGLPELARTFLAENNVPVAGLGRSAIVSQALSARGLGGLHSTSDFSTVLSGAVHMVLRRAYEAAPSGLKPIARRVELDDFRARTFASMSGFSGLEKVGEHGEFTRGTIKDSGESVRLETFGKVFGITRQALVNDDLGAFADMPRRLGIAAAAFEADQLAQLLMANPLMSDGKALFHADHANLASPASALSKDALSAARKAMRGQRDASGQMIGIGPRWLVVGAELETLAEELMAAITPAETEAVQPIRLRIAVEPRLPGYAWYVAADPAECDGLTYAHLASEPGPVVEHRVGFDIDGVEMKVRLDYGAAFIDWRSWHRNAGSAPGQ
ncbi:prohead protease/major capsid protein fusion protein [Hyphomicrobium sp.]|uniref:prohead protease/major capsid protein fusion protein n=1 Tax=Hyphomicrobium sp. TaxID=82 RepID=UPI002FE2A56D